MTALVDMQLGLLFNSAMMSSYPCHKTVDDSMVSDEAIHASAACVQSS